MFKLGLIVNPLAGLGGATGLKGSDGLEIVAEARRRGAELRSPVRTLTVLDKLKPYVDNLEVYCFNGLMGEAEAHEAGLTCRVIGNPATLETTAADTIAAAKALQQENVDLILFAGGDGTARDIFQAVGDQCPVLGVPAGVKMHSGVYAISPQAAAELLIQLITGKLVDIATAEVRDIDEEAFRQGIVKARYFGELLVPSEGQFVQRVKSGGREVESLVLEDIAADIVENMEDDILYLIGPGTTTRVILQALNLENTLLGIDAVLNSQLLGNDLNETALLKLLDEHKGSVKIIVTVIGGQGHILGRGNQQLSPTVVERVGLDNIIIVATKTKITELAGRPLLVDTGDEALDKGMAGFRSVITGYHDVILYPLGIAGNASHS